MADSGPLGSGLRSRAAALVRPTGEPAQWGLVTFAVVGLLGGLLLGLAVRPREIALLPALTAGLVAATGASGPSAIATRVAGFAAASTVVMVALGYAASDRPLLATVLMAAVAVATSAAFGTGPVGGAIGLLGTLAYVLSLVLSTATGARESAGLLEVLVRVAAAAALGWTVVAVGTRWRDRGTDHPPLPAVPAPWRAIRTSVRTLDEHARDGVRCAVPLSGCVCWYQLSESHDALWVLISALVVLLPTGKSTLEAAGVRVLGTLVGALAVVLAAVLAAGRVPLAVLVVVAVAALLLGMAYKPVVPVLAGAGSALAVVVLVGAPSGALETVAALRLLDTVVGTGIALAAGYLLWPRDPADAG